MKKPLYKWYDHLATLTTAEQLSEARRLHRNGNGYFIEITQAGEMGKALAALRNRAKELGCYELGDGSFRQSQTTLQP